MKKYFIVPVNQSLWNNEALVSSLYRHYDFKENAIKAAKVLTLRYNESFNVCSHETRVDIEITLKDYINI